MKYLIAALFCIMSTCANAGLVTLYFDDKTIEIEGMTYVSNVGSVGDFTITGDPVEYKPGFPPSDDFVGTWSGTVYPTDPMSPPITWLGCRFSRLLASDGGDILLYLDCRNSIFFSGFEPG